MKRKIYVIKSPSHAVNHKRATVIAGEKKKAKTGRLGRFPLAVEVKQSDGRQREN